MNKPLNKHSRIHYLWVLMLLWSQMANAAMDCCAPVSDRGIQESTSHHIAVTEEVKPPCHESFVDSISANTQNQNTEARDHTMDASSSGCDDCAQCVMVSILNDELAFNFNTILIVLDDQSLIQLPQNPNSILDPPQHIS